MIVTNAVKGESPRLHRSTRAIMLWREWGGGHMIRSGFDANQTLTMDPPTDGSHRRLRGFLAWCPFFATATQVVPCTFFIALSGYRIAIGGLAVFAASCIGPFEAFHQSAIRIPFFLVAGGLSLLNLTMYLYAKRQRQSPAARWRMQPPSTRERRIQRIQLYSSLITLAMIAGDILNHRLHGFN